MKVYFSLFSSSSRGVAVLLNNNFEHNFIGTRKDDNGNLLALDIHLKSKKTNLEYRPKISKLLLKILVIMPAYLLEILILFFDPELDYSIYVTVNNPRARYKI